MGDSTDSSPLRGGFKQMGPDIQRSLVVIEDGGISDMISFDSHNRSTWEVNSEGSQSDAP
jgi:hypothetical protein